MRDYNNDYSYNHMIRGYRDTWPGKREPARGEIPPGFWVLLSVVSIVCSLFSLVGELCS